MTWPHPIRRCRCRHHKATTAPPAPKPVRPCPVRYGVRLGATDGQGHMVCPTCCSTVVVTERVNGVWVVAEHAFIVTEERSA